MVELEACIYEKIFLIPGSIGIRNYLCSDVLKHLKDAGGEVGV
jgi:hypothetical protein